MIDIKELRIGNYVELFDREVIVESINSREITYASGIKCEYYNLKPILLTEEKLLKFGFKEDANFNFHKDGVLIETFGTALPKSKREYRFRANGIEVVLQYVHQIQNLYFELKREELI